MQQKYGDVLMVLVSLETCLRGISTAQARIQVFLNMQRSYFVGLLSHRYRRKGRRKTELCTFKC